MGAWCVVLYNMFMKKLTNLVYPVYIILLLMGFLFVKQTLSEGDIKVEKKGEKKISIEVKPAVVYMQVQSPYYNQKYRMRLKNTDSVNDFLEELRDKESLYFEKIMYTYGPEIIDVANFKTPDGYRWAVFQGEKDISYDVNDIYLIDETIYYLKLIKIEE
jgi:hypothetical protein